MMAGVDTTSNSISRVLHQLCLHPQAQDRLRAEVVAAFEQYGSTIPYDELSQLPYLDAVCRETLRLYAPAQIVPRVFVHHPFHLTPKLTNRLPASKMTLLCRSASPSLVSTVTLSSPSSCRKVLISSFMSLARTLVQTSGALTLTSGGPSAGWSRSRSPSRRRICLPSLARVL